MICVPLLVDDVFSALADAQAARLAGADLVEFRIDTFAEAAIAEGRDPLAAVLDLIARSPLPAIITCRPSWEGGHYDGPEADRLELMLALLAHTQGPAYLDLELAALDRTHDLATRLSAVTHPPPIPPGGRLPAAQSTTRLIISLHDFSTRPHDLSRRLLTASTLPFADIIKIAYRARSIRDNLELLDLARDAAKPTIALGMGEHGLMSRILAPQAGALLTFAALRDAAATAPGQPTIADLLSLYRFRSITRSTTVYGIIGWPVSHSLSPLMHNAGFEAVSHNGVYVPMPIAASDNHDETYASFKATLLSLIADPRLRFAGASVTLPHKQHLVRLAREQGWSIDHTSDRASAANTLARDPAGHWSIFNTDAPAAVDPLESALGSLDATRVAILGAGGAARAIAHELAARGAHTLIINRTHARAQELAAELAAAGHHATAITLDALTHADAIINCTSVGMKSGPAPDQSPIDEAGLARIQGLKIIQDTVYNPVHTALLTLADKAGIHTIDGVEMFVRQASRQFTLWTGHPAPTGLFDRIVRESLAT